MRNLETEGRDTIDEKEIIIEKTDHIKAMKLIPKVQSIVDKYNEANNTKLRTYVEGKHLVIARSVFSINSVMKVGPAYYILVFDKRYLELAKRLAVELNIKNIEEDYK
jgi:hypothetical protein